jgi:hypothetical protein
MVLLIYTLVWLVSIWFVACPSPHCYAPGWAVTWHEFTLAPAHITCLPVRHSRSRCHLVMVIAHSSPRLPLFVLLKWGWTRSVQLCPSATAPVLGRSSNVTAFRIIG